MLDRLVMATAGRNIYNSFSFWLNNNIYNSPLRNQCLIDLDIIVDSKFSLNSLRGRLVHLMLYYNEILDSLNL
jgi:hypothetical protein